MALGITPLSWAQWLARALDLPFTSYAVNGARIGDVLGTQLPRVRARYDVACLYVAVNDVRDLGFDAGAFTRDAEALVAGLAPAADRLLVLTPPHDLGRPSCAPKPVAAEAVLRGAAARHGALVCSLADFGGWVDVLPDVVHPTAIGQLEIADRAARALGTPVPPSALAGLDRSPHRLARHAPVHARAMARDLVRRGRERLVGWGA